MSETDTFFDFQVEIINIQLGNMEASYNRFHGPGTRNVEQARQEGLVYSQGKLWVTQQIGALAKFADTEAKQEEIHSLLDRVGLCGPWFA